MLTDTQIYNANLATYVVPGPAVWTCGAGDNTPAPVPTGNPATPTTLVTSSKAATSTKAAEPTPTPEVPSCSTAKYGQCGGIGFSGCASCASGSTCSKINDYYSQCV